MGVNQPPMVDVGGCAFPRGSWVEEGETKAGCSSLMMVGGRGVCKGALVTVYVPAVGAVEGDAVPHSAWSEGGWGGSCLMVLGTWLLSGCSRMVADSPASEDGSVRGAMSEGWECEGERLGKCRSRLMLTGVMGSLRCSLVEGWGLLSEEGAACASHQWSSGEDRGSALTVTCEGGLSVCGCWEKYLTPLRNGMGSALSHSRVGREGVGCFERWWTGEWLMAWREKGQVVGWGGA